MTSHTQDMVERAKGILPAFTDDLLLRGITAETTDRIVLLKKADLRLRARYGDMEALEQRIKNEEVSPDDHGLYTDLLEWKAIRHELLELLNLLEAL